MKGAGLFSVLVFAAILATIVQPSSMSLPSQASLTTTSSSMALHPTTTQVKTLIQVSGGFALQAVVTDLGPNPSFPSGTVGWSDGGAGGNFSASGACPLRLDYFPPGESSCHLLYTPAASSSGRTIDVTAAYPGDSSHSSSSGMIALTISGGGITTTTTKSNEVVTTSTNGSATTATTSGGATTTTPSGTAGGAPGFPQAVPLAVASLFIAGSYLLFTRVTLAKEVFRRTSGKIGLALIAFVLLLTFYGLFLDPYPPRAFPCLLTCNGLPPLVDLAHPFGTYATGQDLFSEVTHGAPVDLTIGFEATAVAVLIGTLVGLFAGYGSRIVQDALLAFIQVVLLLPSFAIVVWIYRTYDTTNLFLNPLLTSDLALLLGLFAWPPIALVVRNEVRSVQQKEFIAAARALGAGKMRIIFRHILPNVITSVFSIGAIVFAANFTAESLFAFLGLVNPTSDVVTWGFLLWEGERHIFGTWWIAFFPGLMIVITVLGFSLVGDAISEALNPKSPLT